MSYILIWNRNSNNELFSHKSMDIFLYTSNQFVRFVDGSLPE